VSERDAKLEALLALLAEPGPEPPPALLARTLRLARVELRATSRRAFWRELIQLAAPAAAALPLVLAVNASVVYAGWLALSRWLPGWAADLAVVLPGLYAFGALGWLALFWGALPLLAHQRLARRLGAPAEVVP
jgi:hypothetical protein